MAAKMVYQPNEAHWPDGLASFKAFVSIEEGRKHYPEIPESEWVAVPETDIEDPEIFGEPQTFHQRGLAAIRRTIATGDGVPLQEVLDRLEAKLAKAMGDKRPK